jgi:N-acetyl-anhydromuramyl-L-alanine amidase AmpD
MPVDFDAIPFVQARNYTKAQPGRGIRWIVVHTMEAPEKGATAENIAHYFATTRNKVSAHYCIDGDSIIQCLQTRDVAWAAPGANRHGIQLEHAGYARQSRADWLDDYSQRMLRLSAELCGRILIPKFQIPAQFVGATGLKAGRPGITTHAAVSEAFGQSSHWDPGPAFPMDLYIKQVRSFLEGPPE